MAGVGIIGVGQTPYKRSHPELSSAELIWAAVEEALADANMGIDEIDVIIAGVAPDALSGENGVEKTAILGQGKPFIRVNTGGATGSSTVFAGYDYVASGRAPVALVLAVERMGQATSRSPRSRWRRCGRRCRCGSTGTPRATGPRSRPAIIATRSRTRWPICSSTSRSTTS
jgi:acetyl-CoA acetyltransferase